ncbi:MAG: cellulase family glycosylhydrolase [Reichenbachiella sp.]
MILRLNFLLLFFLGLHFASGCAESTDETVLKRALLSANEQQFDFSTQGGTQTIEITSNANWDIERVESSWYTLSKYFSTSTFEGEETATTAVTITVAPNEDTQTRSTSIVVKTLDNDSIQITLNQEAVVERVVVTNDPQFIASDNTDIRDLTSIQLTQLMGLGWNVGNSLEAISGDESNLTGDETSWGNPVINKKLIDEVKAAGFNSIRIPVSYSHQLENPDNYLIKSAWLDRIEEVVGYVEDNDMYAIVNIHWDGGWMDYPTYENKEIINEKLAAFWIQIALHFRDHSDHLLFAGTNEVHMKDNWDAPTVEYRTVQNSFNQTFVDAVRSTGGRNTYRHLVVQSYNTNISHGTKYLTIPNDPTSERLMVEVHFYDPYGFALQETGGNALWGQDFSDRTDAVNNWGQEAWIDEAFNMMKTTFYNKGYGVILGEYGAIKRSNPANATLEEHHAARNNYLKYVTQSALNHGMVPVYWDNGWGGDNGFALFNRSTGAIVDERAVEAIVSAAE